MNVVKYAFTSGLEASLMMLPIYTMLTKFLVE